MRCRTRKRAAGRRPSPCLRVPHEQAVHNRATLHLPRLRICAAAAGGRFPCTIDTFTPAFSNTLPSYVRCSQSIRALAAPLDMVRTAAHLQHPRAAPTAMVLPLPLVLAELNTVYISNRLQRGGRTSHQREPGDRRLLPHPADRILRAQRQLLHLPPHVGIHGV